MTARHATSPSNTAPVVVWFRRDLRLGDNHALAAAVSSGRPVLPLFLLEEDNAQALPYGAAQAWWLHHSLDELARRIERLGGRLILRRGKAADVLPAFVRETGAVAVYWNRRHDPDGINTDRALKARLREAGIAVQSFAGQLLHDPSRLKTRAGGAYKVYTPFWRALSEGGEPDTPIDAPDRIPSPTGFPASDRLEDWALTPSKPDWASRFAEIWTPGEEAAKKRLRRFVAQGLDGYGEARDFPARDGTSRLSPHLALGEITPAAIWHAARGARSGKGADGLIAFRKEIAWRDFSYHLLFHHPRLASESLDRRFDAFGWRDDEAHFAAWTRGLTGYPIVDAGMRQLWTQGTMHNRVRMIAASFLIKDLLIDWRRGEAWFRDTLVDADPASNAASWQWVAGCGADAAPFFRIFNPVLQGERFDPDGAYVKTFVPELTALPKTFVHRPFAAPDAVLEAAKISLGTTYPQPLVDHRAARDRALAAFGRIRSDRGG
ncbi:deoxyribodipyrimidine photo-lyase [Mycoplana sp. MJR14]|uniref:cryptochrome/photolyase family protein n=1 Tax=Mycoplana sp. MJR14 TaxID=3032583 RepID=UPI0023DCCBA4|nr:deoxyribodipyrimidine photo-lyase [Mycoplana sp. MJR14]MDF1635460.1 deoxyribodipyrimidine photo-lyase [Mycoplana sp. MJR14]